MNHKICLITYCNSYNYGAALQLYATYKKLEAMGNQVTVLNYQNKFENSQHTIRYLFTKAKIKEKIRFLVSSYVFGSSKNGKRNFNKFYNAMNYSVPVSNIGEFERLTDFDVFCVGSDQVWNPRITDEFDDIFTLNGNFVKKVSYASSMGSNQFGGYDTKEFLRRLASFDYLSVREKGAYEYLHDNLPDKQIEQVVDPTILYGKAGWEKSIDEAGIKQSLPEKYVLIYALGGCFDELNVLAHKIADKMGTKVAVITLSNRPKDVDFLVNRATPLEFVNLIKNAFFVVTNSFHGTCFSFLFGTPFYSVRYGDNPARSEELLNKYALSHRLYRDGNRIEDMSMRNEDIILAQNKLNVDADVSKRWLESVLNE